MIIEVSDLGPITKGTINLSKELTILTGPNNSGKSYLTYLIHGIGKVDEMSKYLSFFNKIKSIFEENEGLKEVIEKGKVINFEAVILESGNLDKFSEALTEAVSKLLFKVFASNAIRPSVSIKVPSFTLNQSSESFETFYIENGSMYATTRGGFLNAEFFQSKIFDDYKDNPYGKAIHIISLITHSFINKSLGPDIGKRSYFFPAERTAINLFAKHITSVKAEITDDIDDEVIAGLSDEELGRRLRNRVNTGPKYPYAIRNYINFVNTFKKGEEEGEFSSISSSIEVLLTGGKIHLNEFEQPVFLPKDSSTPLDLHLTSSLVKSLSYLILYLRYTAKKGDLIIIDEPELNLHPDLQIALGKIIAQMVNAGLRIIISTHSDYLIKELNNLILLHNIPQTENNTQFLTEHEYQSDYLLDMNKVSAYYLNDNTIIPISIEENGIEVPSINDAMTSIDSVAQEIFFRLEE